MQSYNNYEKLNRNQSSFTVGIPILGYSNNDSIVYDVITINQVVLRGTKFVPFGYNNLRIDFSLNTIKDFNDNTHYYSSSLYDLDFLSVLKDITSYSNNNKVNYIPDLVFIVTFDFNISVILGSISSTMTLFDSSALLDTTNPTPTHLDISKDRKDLTRIYIGKSIIVCNHKTGAVSVNTNSSITLNANNVNINAQNITLGKSSSHKLILGDLFKTLFNTHTHPVPSLGTSGVPTSLMSSTQLSDITKTK